MKYRPLGRSGLRVSVVAMGTMTFGGIGDFKSIGSTDAGEARRQLDICLDSGVNLVDTANVYSGGIAEEILGQALMGRRDRVLIATKVGMRVASGPNDLGSSRVHMIRECESSLRRLRTDYIDLYQVHAWDGQTPLEETLATLQELICAGKVRYVGCSNFSCWHLMKAFATSAMCGLPNFVSHQVHYSLQAREAEYELVPAAVDLGLGILVWSPLAGGLLSGKYRRDGQAPEGTRRVSGWTDPPIHDQARLFHIVDVLVNVADRCGVSAAQVALAYLLRKPAVTSVILGARTEEQLRDNLAAVDLDLGEEEMNRLDDVSALPLIYPYWHQAKWAGERLSLADLSLLGRELDN